MPLKISRKQQRELRKPHDPPPTPPSPGQTLFHMFFSADSQDYYEQVDALAEQGRREALLYLGSFVKGFVAGWKKGSVGTREGFKNL